ncbi:MAG TPA: C4-type zinc ribbon domain-containing protein [Gemmataceae bacterium]|nr:C4-type zinc ribbon domain-containing protein [Gemmataceae bacterium]
MSGPAAILRELHRLRRHTANLQAQIERIPNALKVQQAKVTKAQGTLQEAHESIKRSKISQHEKEVTLRSKNQQIAKHQKQLNESTSKKEYDALQAEISADKKACQEVEDEILNDMVLMEEKTVQMPELEKAVERTKEELAQFETSSQARLADLKELLNQAKKSVTEMEATLPADILPQYEWHMAAQGEDAMAVVHNRTCRSCYTEITAQNYNELKQEQFVLCKNCGRILYLEEEP